MRPAPSHRLSPLRRLAALRGLHALRTDADARRQLGSIVLWSALAAGLIASLPGAAERSPYGAAVPEALLPTAAPVDPLAKRFELEPSYSLRVPDPSMRVHPPLRRRPPRRALVPVELPSAEAPVVGASGSILPPQTIDLPVALRSVDDPDLAPPVAIPGEDAWLGIAAGGTGAARLATRPRTEGPTGSRGRDPDGAGGSAPADPTPARDIALAAAPSREPASIDGTSLERQEAPAAAVADAAPPRDEVGDSPASDPAGTDEIARKDDVRGLSQEIRALLGTSDPDTPGPGIDPESAASAPPAVDHPIASLVVPAEPSGDSWPAQPDTVRDEVLDTLGIPTQGLPEELPSVAKAAPESAGQKGDAPAEAFGKSLGKGSVPAPGLLVAATSSQARSASASGTSMPVPEPSTAALVLVGLAALGARTRRASSPERRSR